MSHKKSLSFEKNISLFCIDTEPFTADAEDAEMANYAEFHALKLALVNDNADNDNNDNADNQDNNMETRSAKVSQQEGETNLTVYPNPADDVLFVELRGGAGIANVGLYDLQGRAVGTRFIASATGASATVNMRDIPAGVYVLRVTDTNGKEYHQ